MNLMKATGSDQTFAKVALYKFFSDWRRITRHAQYKDFLSYQRAIETCPWAPVAKNGLCYNLNSFIRNLELHPGHAGVKATRELFIELMYRDFAYNKQERDAFGVDEDERAFRPYPWGSDRYNDFVVHQYGQFADEQRTEWVMRRIQELGSELTNITIKDFLTYWLAQVESGEPNEGVRVMGLCNNYVAYVQDQYAGCADMYRSLSSLFESSHPFGGYERYQQDRIAKTQHLNPLRVQWVKNYLEHVNAK